MLCAIAIDEFNSYLLGSNICACNPVAGMKYGYVVGSGDKEEHGYLLDFINTVTKKTR